MVFIPSVLPALQMMNQQREEDESDDFDLYTFDMYESPHDESADDMHWRFWIFIVLFWIAIVCAVCAPIFLIR